MAVERYLSERRADYLLSKPTKARERNQPSRADLKAYEARRAVAKRSDDAIPTDGRPVAAAAKRTSTAGRSAHRISREEEYRIIKSDMKRLLVILGVLLVVLVIASIVLR